MSMPGEARNRLRWPGQPSKSLLGARSDWMDAQDTGEVRPAPVSRSTGQACGAAAGGVRYGGVAITMSTSE